MCGTVSAQTDSTAVGRKKVAVVLSGGGAKGMAHIGVLKVLERAGIPIDIITGTNLAELFRRLCTGYTDSLDFSRDLQVPFACVATNIMDNSEVVFHSGRLPQAVRMYPKHPNLPHRQDFCYLKWLELPAYNN